MTVTNIRPELSFNERRLRSNLLRCDAAMGALAEAGIDRADVEALGLGLKEPYERADGTLVANVVTYPIAMAGGRRRYGYLNLPAVTLNPGHVVAWSPGDARTVAFGEAGLLLVTGSPLSVFQIGGSSQRRMLNVAAIASSNPDAIPPEWREVAFWGKWDRVIVCDDVPPAIASVIASSARRPIEQAEGVTLRLGPASSAQDRLDEWIDAVLMLATPYGSQAAAIAGGERDIGDFEADPVPLHGGFAKGHLYYPFVVERRQHAGSGGRQLFHSYQTLVLRSDGAILEAVTLPAPPGVSASQRVHALTDGTRIVEAPAPSRNATWSLGAIQAFASARAEGQNPCSRQAEAVLADVHRFISSRVALPEPDDYWVATLFVILTHMFRVFRALPIILVEGPRGTGKTELAAAMASLGFNAAIMGQGSARALVRLTRECGGLVVLDDAEGLGGAGFTELAQCLKVGYRAATARKPITLASGRVEIFDFYGPRVITCTRGVEPVLASRCIDIRTATATMVDLRPEVETDALRDELHALAMMESAGVHRVYGEIIARSSDRSGEIWAPLEAIAEALACADACAALSRARRRR